MSYENDYPWGCAKLTLHIEGSRERVVIDPNDPASVVEGVEKLIARNIVRLVGTPKENPKYEEWIEAVRNRETKMSFSEWSVRNEQT